MLPIDTSRRNALKLLGAGALASTIGTGTAVATGESSGNALFEFDSMVGNTLTGEAGAIRGIPAGGLPWVVDEAETELSEDGRLEVGVEGLVLAETDSVPEDLRGINPVPEFKAILSCLAPGEEGHVTETRETGTVSASMDGDAEIDEALDLPDTCIAPIVFVTHPNDAWFAATGF